MFSQYKKTCHASHFSYNLSSLIIFTLASLLFLCCSSVKVYANDTFDCPWGQAISSFFYQHDGNFSISCTPVSGLGLGNETCGGHWAAAPDGNQPNCNKCMSASNDNVWIRCPAGQIVTGAFADISTGCQTNGLILDCAPLPAGWSFGGSQQVLTGVHASSGPNTYAPEYTNIQPPAPTCNNDNDCDSGENCSNCPNDCCWPTCSLSASPTSGPAPTNVTYSWTSTYDDDGQISYSCTFGPSSGVLGNPNGSATFSVSTSGSCTVTAANSVGSAPCTAFFTLAPTCNNNGSCDSGETCALCPTGDNCCAPGFPSCSLTFSPTTGPNPTTVNYSWSQTNDADNVSPFTCTNGVNGTLTGNGSNSFSATSTFTCTLTVVNSASQSSTCSASFTLNSITCPDGSCSGGETCSTCPADCGACVSCPNGSCSGGETCSTCPADCGPCPPAAPACSLLLSPTSGTPATLVTYTWSQSNDANGQIPMSCSNGGPNTTLTSPPNSGSGTFNPTSSGACNITVTNAVPQTITCSANFRMTCNNNGSCDPGETCALCPTLDNCCNCNGPLTFVPPLWVDPALRDGSLPSPPPPTQIRTIHFTQMRDRINTLRIDAGLIPFNWAGCGFNAVNDARISTRLINCSRQALRQVYTACSQPIPAGIQGSVGTNTPIRKQHIEDLREAIDQAK